MRHLTRRISLLAAIGSIVAVGCSDDGGLTGPDLDPRISVTIRPTAESVAQGDSVEVTAIVTRSGGYTGSVSVAIEGVPSGMTGTVSDAVTTGDVTTATVTVRVDSTVAANTYDIVVRATGPGVADAFVNFALTVMIPPDYSLSLIADTIKIDRGSVGSTRVGLARINFTNPVDLAVEGAPSGVTVMLDPSSVSGDSSIVTFTLDTTVALGDYTLTVRGVAAGMIDRTATMILRVTSQLKVAFRLDDIQAHWCTSTAADVIQLFVDKGIPLGVGIVGGDTWFLPLIDMAPDTPGGLLVNRFKNVPTIQMLSHSYNHTDLTTMTEQEQRQDFTDQLRVFNSFGIIASGFIPPENKYDATTVTLVTEFGMNVLSAQCTWTSDQPPQPITCQPDDRDPNQPVDGITHIPVGAVFGDNNWEDLNSPLSWTAAEGWASRQLEAQQFSVFMLHPQEMTTDGTCNVDAADPGKMATLTTILDEAKLVWSLLSFDEMAEYLTSR